MKSIIPKTLVIPDGYSISESGVYFGSKQLSSTPVWVYANTKTTNQGWGIKIQWLSQNKVKSAVIGIRLLHGSDKMFKEALQHIGISVISSPIKFKQYLVMITPLEPTVCVMQDIYLKQHGKVDRVHYATCT